MPTDEEMRKRAKRGRAHAGRLAVIETKAMGYVEDIDALILKKEPDYETAAHMGREKMLELSRLAADTSDSALNSLLTELLVEFVDRKLGKRDIRQFIRERMGEKR